MELVAFLSTGKGTWGHVSRLIADGEWDNVVLFTNDFGKENYKGEKADLVIVDVRKKMEELIQDMVVSLKEKVKGTEVAINLISGSGKEHMALLSAIIKAGISFRLMALTTDGVKEL